MPTPTPVQVPAAGAPAGALGILVTGDFLPAACGGPAPTNPSGGILAFVPNGEYGSDATDVQLVTLAGTQFSDATISTPNSANSCSVDEQKEIGVCTANNTDVYLINPADINVANPSSTPNATLTSAGNGSFQGGPCTNCGVVVDTTTHTAVIGVSLASNTSGYQLLNLNTNQFGSPFVVQGSQISESWAVDPGLEPGQNRHLILSPFTGNANLPGQYQVFDITDPANPVQFNFTGSFDLSFGRPESAAIDSTGVILGTGASTGDIFLANLSQLILFPPILSATPKWFAPSQIQTLGALGSNGFLLGTSAIAVAYGSHEAFLIDENGISVMAAANLPAVAGAGPPAFGDYAVSSVPNDPTGAQWTMPGDPHASTAALVCLNSAKGVGVVVNAARTFLAEVDLAALIAAPRSKVTSTLGHGVDPTFDLVANGVVKFVAVHPGTIQLAPMPPITLPTTSHGSTSQSSVFIINVVNPVGILQGTVDVSQLGAPFAVSPAGAFALVPGQPLMLNITFSPTAAGAFSGNFTIDSNDPTNRAVTVGLNGSAT